MSFDSLIQMFGTDYTLEILRATNEPKTASELREQLGIPSATCYRRLNELQHANFLEATEPVETTEDRSSTVYERTIEHARFSFQSGVVELSSRD